MVEDLVVHPFRVILAEPQQADQAAGHGGEGNVSVERGEAPGVLAGPDVPSARGARPVGAPSRLSPEPLMKRAMPGWVQPSLPEIRNETEKISAGSEIPAQARSIIWP